MPVLSRSLVVFVAAAALAALAPARADGVWQWSVPTERGRAYLWIPPDCARVRGFVLAQHNLIEPRILEHAVFRRTLERLGFAEVFIAPSLDPVYAFDRDTPALFRELIARLADVSGYGELASAPIVPLGHSAHASFPWNFAAENPGRTLAILSLKGDAPQTPLTGSGRPNPDWGARSIDGIPGLFVMSEDEWWEARLAPLFAFRSAHPQVPLAVLADTDHGHFDASDELITFLADFITAAAQARLPTGGGTDLRPVDPRAGWCLPRWRPDHTSPLGATPWDQYPGSRDEVVWVFDEAMARASEAYQTRSLGKRAQQVSFTDHGEFLPITNQHVSLALPFRPEADGVTFSLAADFIQPLPRPAPLATKDARPVPTSVTPSPARAGEHAPGAVTIAPIVGPVETLAPGRFRATYDRLHPPGDSRGQVVWFLASHPGDDQFKGAVRPAALQLPVATVGEEQSLSLPSLPDLPHASGVIDLPATSSAGLPVNYMIREGPAVIREGRLHLLSAPPRSRFPLTVTLVAGQRGRTVAPFVRAAKPVVVSFRILAP